MKLFKRKPKPSIAAAAIAGAGSTVVTAGALREFVYLDEVSVYSLTSSPDAPPPVSMSEAANATSGEVLGTQLEVSAPGLVRSGVSAELTSDRSNGLEVQRHFNIQSQFARLHRLYSESFALTASNKVANGKPSNDLTEALKTLKEQRRAARVDDLDRGALVELRVELRAQSIFDVSVFIRAAGGLIDRHPELLPVPDPQAIRQLMDLGDFLSELMENLVPIEGLSTAYRVLEDLEGDPWVVDVSALERIFTGSVVSSPIRVVGVAEHECFWKDTRRILHSDSEFDVLGRISRSGLQAEWSPVKLTDAFDRVVPGVGKSLTEGLSSLKNLSSGDSKRESESTPLLLVALKIQEELASRHQVERPNLPVELAEALVTFEGGLEEKLLILNRISDDFYFQHPELKRNAEVTASIRHDALRNFETLPVPPSLPAAEADKEHQPLALELEFIAMYW